MDPSWFLSTQLLEEGDVCGLLRLVIGFLRAAVTDVFGHPGRLTMRPECFRREIHHHKSKYQFPMDSSNSDLDQGHLRVLV